MSRYSNVYLSDLTPTQSCGMIDYSALMGSWILIDSHNHRSEAKMDRFTPIFYSSLRASIIRPFHGVVFTFVALEVFIIHDPI